MTSQRFVLSILSLVGAAFFFASLPAAALAVPPANDNFANAEVLSGSAVIGTNVDATKEAGEPNHAGSPGGASVWYRWTALASGTAGIDACQSDFDTLLAVYTGSSVSALTPVASNDNDLNCPDSQSLVTFEASSGTTYRIAVDGVPGSGDGTTGNIYLVPSFPVPPPLPLPVLTGTDPPSPADYNFPLIKGTAEPGSEVELFDNPMCYGSPVAVGSAATFASPGIQVFVPDNESMTLYAKAKKSGLESNCSGAITYDEVTVPPCPPPGVPPGATYRGSHSQGGTVCFTVTANWSHVTSFLVVGDDCSYWNQIIFSSPVPVAIDRSFRARSFTTPISGSFDAGQGAAGTYSDRDGCDTGVVSWTASTAATPPWAVPLPVAAADRTAPALRLRAKRSQRAVRQKGILVEVGCPTEACTAAARGTVSVPGAARSYGLKAATKQIPRGGKAKLKLKFSKKALKAVKRALKKRKKIKARVTVTVKDSAGNGATKKASIRLKR